MDSGKNLVKNERPRWYVGVSVVSATAVFGRLIFPAQTYRPGTLGCADEGENNFGYVRMGSMGELGQFDSIAQPQLEVFCTGADTAQTVFMDCIRVRVKLVPWEYAPAKRAGSVKT